MAKARRPAVMVEVVVVVVMAEGLREIRAFSLDRSR